MGVARVWSPHWSRQQAGSPPSLAADLGGPPSSRGPLIFHWKPPEAPSKRCAWGGFPSPTPHPLLPALTMSSPEAHFLQLPEGAGPTADDVSASHLLATGLPAAQGTLRTFKVSHFCTFWRREGRESREATRGLGV